MAVEKDFHWSRYVPGVESRLSEFEDSFASTFQAIRRNQLEELPAGAIARAVRHFALRLPKMRSFLELGTREMLELFRSAIQQTERRTLRYNTMQDAIGAITKELPDQRQDPESGEGVRKRLKDIFMHDFQAIYYNARLDIMADVLGQLDVLAHVREVHSESLLNELDVLVAGASRRGMKWSLRRFDESLSFGDVGPLAISTPGAGLEPLIGAPASGNFVMAVDSHTLLFGERFSNVEPVTASEWNGAVARLSKVFFIAEERSIALEELGRQIGCESRDVGLLEILAANPEAAAAMFEKIRGLKKENSGQTSADARSFMRVAGARSPENRLKSAAQAYFGNIGTNIE